MSNDDYTAKAYCSYEQIQRFLTTLDDGENENTNKTSLHSFDIIIQTVLLEAAAENTNYLTPAVFDFIFSVCGPDADFKKKLYTIAENENSILCAEAIKEYTDSHAESFEKTLLHYKKRESLLEMTGLLLLVKSFVGDIIYYMFCKFSDMCDRGEIYSLAFSVLDRFI